jgi:hypothetical protein
MNFKQLVNKKWKKALLITGAVIIALVVLVIAFISPIAKYVIEKYDEKILGRQITLSWIYVNPFTGYAHISDLVLSEQNKDSVFVKAGGVNIDFAMLKLFKKTYEISYLTINNAEIHLKQQDSTFNFSDLITRFSPKDTIKKDTTKTRFSLLDIKVKNSKFFYYQKEIPVDYFITDLDLESPGLRWDSDTLEGNIAFKNGPGTGDIKAYFGMNLKSLNFSTKVNIKKFDLELINQYFQDLSDFGMIRANVDVDVDAFGTLKSQVDFTAKGYVGVNNFHFGKNVKEDYASFTKLALNMIKVSPRTFDYAFDTIAIVHPFFKYERYDSLDNLSRMFGVGGKNIKAAQARSDAGQFNLIIELAKFVKEIGKNFLKSHYSAKKFQLYDGDIRFNDFALREEFSAAASPLDIVAKDIDRNNKALKVNLNTNIKPHGELALALGINPKDFSDFNITYNLQKIAIPDFNPYIVTYTSFPLKNGTLSFKGQWIVVDSMINSVNHLVIVAPTRGKRIKRPDTKWLPIPLILSILKEPGNIIDYEVPIQGKITDPKFKVKDVVLDILKNIFIKPPTLPFRAAIREKEYDVDKFQLFLWSPRQTELTGEQVKYVKDLKQFLKRNKEATLTVAPVLYSGREKEHTLFYLAKKKYYMQVNKMKASAFTEADSVAVDKLSIKDGGFINALDKSIDSSYLLFTVQEKCARWVDSSAVKTAFQAMEKRRIAAFKAAFEDDELVSRIQFKPMKSDVPTTGFSYFQIDYSVDIPEKLRTALDKVDMGESKFIQSRGKLLPINK